MATVRIMDVRLDGGTQIREQIDPNTVAAYADAYLDNPDALPPIIVFFDGEDYWLADGFHRVKARMEAGIFTIKADIRDGTLDDAVKYACGANAQHGLRRTNADIRRSVTTALQRWPNLSDTKIAEICFVSRQTVSKYRKTPTPKTDPIKEMVARETPMQSLHRETTQEDDEPEDEPCWTTETEEPAPVEDSPPVNTVKEFDRPVKQFIAKVNQLKREFDSFAESNPYTQHFYAEHEKANFAGFLRSAVFVLTSQRPFAVCGLCQGEGCEECGDTGVLPQNRAEALL